MKEKVHNIALIYHVYYKCIKTNLNVHALHKSPNDKTLLIQSSNNDTNINIPQMIEWKDVTLPDQWITVNENYKHNKKQSTVQDIQDIQQFTDGYDGNWSPQKDPSILIVFQILLLGPVWEQTNLVTFWLFG
ncbi:hypothetical protein ACSBR2_006210 [Camellia fascicularis]